MEKSTNTDNKPKGESSLERHESPSGDLMCEVHGHDWEILPNGTFKCKRCPAT